MKHADESLPYKCLITMHYETEGRNYKEVKNNLLKIVENDLKKIKNGYSLTKTWDLKCVRAEE